MANYRETLEKDLDRWIAAGLVDPANRAAILDSIPETRRVDAVTALGMAGALLFGLGVIALIGANWDGMSRLTRFGVVLSAFALASITAAMAAYHQRPFRTDALSTLAALLFAAAIGLTGQIFDLVGEPRTALHLAAVVALGLGLAGPSIGAGVAALAFAGLGDFNDFGRFSASMPDLPLLGLVVPIAAGLAWRWRSVALAHAASAGLLALALWLSAQPYVDDHLTALFASAGFGLLAFAARAVRRQNPLIANVFYGWMAWGALAYFAASYLFWSMGSGQSSPWLILHRLVWAAAAVSLIALGRHDRHALVTTVGVLGLMGAVAAVLMDWGVDLVTAGLIFLALSAGAILVALALRNAGKPIDPDGRPQ